MNRTELQSLADLRIKEAQLLLSAPSPSYPGAYYLAGYAVECALKSCIARRTKQYDFPDKELANKSYTHDLEQLLIVAKLNNTLENDMKRDKKLAAYWASVVNWKEIKRYELGITQREAQDICNAIADPNDGVLQWLKKWW